MRIPFTKAYRAFEEFDGVSREECERCLRRVACSVRWLPYAMAGAAVLGALGSVLGLVLFVVYSSQTGWLRNAEPTEDQETLGLIIAVAVVVLGAALSALLTRDLVVYWGIKREIHRARCPKCKQSLLGVPVRAPHSPGTPMPGDAWVRCPECGKRYNLMKIGLTPRDLIPFEFREASPDIGKKRGEWFGREFADDDQTYRGW